MHGSARTTPAMRAEIQAAAGSIRHLATVYGLNPKTVAKWRRRDFTHDSRMGPKRAPPKTLSPAEEAMCVAFRKHALLPLDDCLYALQLQFPQLTRSGLHRLYQRHGVSRLPAIETDSSRERNRTGRLPIGNFYVDTAPVRTGSGRINMFVAFDRVGKFAYASLYEAATPETAADFLRALVKAVPHRVHTVLTSGSDIFAAPAGGTRAHAFADACRRDEVCHLLAPRDDAWTIGAGPVEETADRRETAQPPPYRDHDHLRDHFFAFFDTYNFARRLKTLKGLTPYQYICRCWAVDPASFRRSPLEYAPKLIDGAAPAPVNTRPVDGRQV